MPRIPFGCKRVAQSIAVLIYVGYAQTERVRPSCASGKENPMARCGIIDLGSNSVRLDVYNVAPKEDKQGQRDFEHIFSSKKMAGLAAYTTDGIFSSRGIQVAKDVLGDLLDQAKDLDCKKVSIFATAVLRECKNSNDAVATLEGAIDKPIRLLSGEEEANLGFLGATSKSAMLHGTLLDLGGGSTELTCVKDGSDTLNLSLPLGCVKAYAQYVNLILPTAREVQCIKHIFNELLRQKADPSIYRCSVLHGIGGSVRATAKLAGAAFTGGYAPKAVSAKTVTTLLGMMENETHDFCHLAAKAVPDRLHTIGPGLAIIHAAMTTFDADTLQICKNGVREGYLVKYMLGE